MAGLTPEQAVDRLEELHASACDGLRSALARFADFGRAADGAGTSGLPLSRTVRRLAADRRRCPTRDAPGRSSRSRAAMRPPSRSRAFFRALSARPAAAAGRGVRRDASRSGSAAQEIPYPFVARRAATNSAAADLSVSRTRALFPDAAALACRRRDRRRHLRARRGRAAAARAVRRRARRFLAAPAGALHRHRLARRAAVDPADQLPPLCRPVRPPGPGASCAGRHGVDALVLPGGVADRAQRHGRSRTPSAVIAARPGTASRCRPIT